MADLTSRRDHWTDYLPGNVQQSINTNPLLNALGRALQRPAPDLTRGIDHDQYGSVSDRNWLLEQAAGGPPKLNPLAAEMIDKGGLLANFLGPGVKLPAVAPKPTGIRAYHGSPHDFNQFITPAFFSKNENIAGPYRYSGFAGDNMNGAWRPSEAGTALAGSVLDASGGNRDLALQSLRAMAQTARQDVIRSEATEAARLIESGQGKFGTMYEVNIPEPTAQYHVPTKPDQVAAIKDAKAKGHKVIEFPGDQEIVVLDRSLIEILRKYGLLPPVAAGTAAALSQQEPPL